VQDDHQPRPGNFLPFNWSINPYRVAPTLARTVSEEALRSSWETAARSRSLTYPSATEIFGTVRRGAYRRYVKTTVLSPLVNAQAGVPRRLADGTSSSRSGITGFSPIEDGSM
jgi:hypothetical protein